MSKNRQQRRAEKHKGKRPGETYADVLAKRKMIQEAVEQSVHDRSIALEADIKTQRVIWMAIEALNRAFGFGGERAKRFMLTLEEVATEFEEMVIQHGSVYAVEKLRQRCEQITGEEVKEVHEEEIRQARKENEANGIFFSSNKEEW